MANTAAYAGVGGLLWTVARIYAARVPDEVVGAARTDGPGDFRVFPRSRHR